MNATQTCADEFGVCTDTATQRTDLPRLCLQGRSQQQPGWIRMPSKLKLGFGDATGQLQTFFYYKFGDEKMFCPICFR